MGHVRWRLDMGSTTMRSRPCMGSLMEWAGFVAEKCAPEDSQVVGSTVADSTAAAWEVIVSLRLSNGSPRRCSHRSNALLRGAGGLYRRSSKCAERHIDVYHD